MNEKDLHTECEILYKTENSDGWYYAIMSGSKETCIKECEKLKKEQNWFDYDCRESARYANEINIPFQNVMPEADDIYLLTDLIYNPDDNKFYHSKETIPYPKTKKRTSKLNIFVKGEGEDEILWIPDDLDDFSEGTDVAINFNKNAKHNRIYTNAEYFISYIPKFIKRLKETGYSNFDLGEYFNAKFLAWTIQDKVRFVVQDYCRNEVVIIVDKLIDKNLFYKEFKNLDLKLKKYIKKHNKNFKKLKALEDFLQNLKWDFDASAFYSPQEYTCLDCDNTKTNKLKLFKKTIAKKSEKHIIDFNTYEEQFCYRVNEYYYWNKGNEIRRRFFHSYKTKDVVRFVYSKDFELKKGMSLTDVYKQLLDKGYNQAVECSYKNKKFLIYANGQTESTEANKNIKEELEKIIQKIAPKAKESLTVSEFVHLLKNKITHVSFRDGTMKL